MYIYIYICVYIYIYIYTFKIHAYSWKDQAKKEITTTRVCRMYSVKKNKSAFGEPCVHRGD